MSKPGAMPGRDWPNLRGTVHDVRTLQEMLTLLYGFHPRDVVTLTDQNATRSAILSALEQHLVAPAAKGDVAFFYYAGHGSQVRNSLSDEPDQLDESLVPADSRVGAADIRDKELRPLFNRILDRGARLTVLLDSCHSGSGARGLASGARPRGIRADVRDIADRASGPRPEERGALVIAATQDFDPAWETRGDDGRMHGAFSWAWIRAMRDAAPGEAAVDTFLRAQARLRGETPYQEPVLAGNAEARLSPFLGARSDSSAGRAVVAIERIRSDGTVVLQGGWANGLSPGSELRLLNEPELTARLRVTAILGLGRSEARLEPGAAMPRQLRSGALLEVAGWAAPPGRPLRVWTPGTAVHAPGVRMLAQKLAAEAAKRGIRWVTDPVDATAAYLLRRGSAQWELLGPYGGIARLGGDDTAVAAIAKLPAGASLFVQLPAPTAILAAAGGAEGITPAQCAEEADYILVGRFTERRTLEYAWVRPSVIRRDAQKTGLPARSRWVVDERRDGTSRASVAALRDSVLRLRRIHAWHLLESPPQEHYAYRLALNGRRTGNSANEGVVRGGDVYDLVLRARAGSLPPRADRRYLYVFTIDSNGRSVLLFPRSGSVENRHPLTAPAPPEIVLDAAFEIAPPYGVDTYFLLSSDEPLPNPWVLEWDGVRGGEPSTPLERLLALTGAGARERSIVTPSNWSLEKVVFEAVAPRNRTE